MNQSIFNSKFYYFFVLNLCHCIHINIINWIIFYLLLNNPHTNLNSIKKLIFLIKIIIYSYGNNNWKRREKKNVIVISRDW
jgi:hypothetical protein